MSTKNQTPKQMQIKVNSILKGIDNNVTTSIKAANKAQEGMKSLTPLLSGLAAVATAKPVPATKVAVPKPVKAAKPEKPAKPTKEEKEATKAAAKPVKPVKTAPPAKAAKPAPAAKPAGTTAKPASDKKEPVEGRPHLKDAIKEMLKLSGGKAPAAKLYHDACGKYGNWSRQGFYAAINDKSTFHKSTDESYELAPIHAAGEEDVETFLDKSAKATTGLQVA